jgi:hypothetical protein
MPAKHRGIHPLLRTKTPIFYKYKKIKENEKKHQIESMPKHLGVPQSPPIVAGIQILMLARLTCDILHTCKLRTTTIVGSPGTVAML